MTDSILLTRISQAADRLGVPYHRVLALVKQHHLGVLRPGPLGTGLTPAEVTQIHDLLVAQDAAAGGPRRAGRPRAGTRPLHPYTEDPTPPPGEVGYTVPEAAARLALPVYLVRRYVAAGILSREAQGSQGRLSRDDLDTIRRLVQPARLSRGYLRTFLNYSLLLAPAPREPWDTPLVWCGPDTPAGRAQAVREAAVHGRHSVQIGAVRLTLIMIDGRPYLAEMDESGDETETETA